MNRPDPNLDRVRCYEAQSAHEAMCRLRTCQEMLLEAAKTMPALDGLYDLRRAVRGLAAALQPIDEVLRKHWIAWRDSLTGLDARSEASRR